MARFFNGVCRYPTWAPPLSTHLVVGIGLTPLFALMAIWGWYASVGEVEGQNDGPALNSDDFPAMAPPGETNSVAALGAGPAPSASLVTYSSIDLGHDHACGVLTSGKIVCWGRDDHGQAAPPDGEFKSVSAGRYDSCGIRADDTVVCWGQGIAGTPEDTAFSSVSVHDDTACGITLTGSIMCWSGGEAYQVQADGYFRQVSVGNGHGCALRTDATLHCWGRNDHGQANAPTGTFQSISAGDIQTCGLRADSTVACWGSDWLGRSSPPSGTYRHVATLWDFSCGVRTDGMVVCWGFEGYGDGKTNAPGGNDFQKVDTGSGHACALKTNGAVVCWGLNSDGRAEPPGGTRYEPPLPVSNIAVCNGPNAEEVVISWDATPRATHYRIGYVNMAKDYPRAKASVTGEWIEAFIYVDVNARNLPVRNGRAQYTLRRLVQGDRHAFTVLTSNNVVNTAKTISGTYAWPQNPRWQFLTVADPESGCTDAAAAQPTPNDTDRDTLIAIYHSLDGRNWRNRDNWLSSGPLDTWHGVSADAANRVVRLDMGRNSLRGEFPVDLANLTNLRHIDLSANPISGEIPPDMGSLAELRHLNIYNTRITGAIPPELGNLANLDHFGLGYNRLTGPIPLELGNMRDLRFLALDGNQLTGNIPPELGNLTEMEGLFLSDNQLTGQIPPELGDLPRLQQLELTGNPLTGCIPASLRRFGDHGLGLPFC